MVKTYLILSVFFVMLIACKNSTATDKYSGNSFVKSGSQQEYKAEQEDVPNRARMGNPASTRCINDGYQLEPVVKNGVIVQYLCINPQTGLKCEEWRYFRNECSLK